MIELTTQDRLDLRKHLVKDISADSVRLATAHPASTAAADTLDRLASTVLALRALGPPSDERHVLVEEGPVIRRLADAAAEELEDAWQQQDPIAWIWWAPVAEKLRGARRREDASRGPRQEAARGPSLTVVAQDLRLGHATGHIKRPVGRPGRRPANRPAG